MEFELFKGRDPKSNRKVLFIFLIFYTGLMLWIIGGEYNWSIGAFLQDDILFTIVAIAFPIGMICLALFDNQYSRGKFIVAENGITFSTKNVKCFMPWEILDYVVIRMNVIHFYSKQVVRRVQPNVTCYPLYIPKVTTDSNGKNTLTYENPSSLSPKNCSTYYMYVRYSEEVLDEVKKYFKKDITNEYSLHLKGMAKW